MDIQLQRSYATPISNSTLLPLLLMSLSTQKYSPRIATSISDEYDYIIVGGGAAGSVIASRLSEEPCVTVLLLEAGSLPPILTEVPALARYLRGNDLDWKFKTVPQRHAASGLVNQQISWPTGKMLGGSAGFNGMVYVRGNRKDYDLWAAQGATGWSYRDVFPYFLELEDNRNPAFLYNGFHAFGGPITMEQPRYNPVLKQAASLAAEKLGYRFVDSNGAKQTGFYDLQANIRNGQRCSPVKGYLVPSDTRENLDILVNSMVTRIIVEGDRAAGVEFFDGNFHVVKARREVILTAGVNNTPKILMLSGIGPREELNKFNIPVIADLPVGKNFHDHCGTHYLFTMSRNFRSFDDKVSDPRSINQYILSRTGPLAAADNLIIAFGNGLNVTSYVDFPSHQVYIAELPNSSLKNFRLKDEIYKQLLEPYEGRPVFRCSVSNLHPKSRGTVSLHSADPFDSPAIDPNYLQNLQDLEDIVDGLLLCKSIVSTDVMWGLGARPLETLMPGCEIYAGNDNEYFKCFARKFTVAFHHPVGSTKMGDASDTSTVVDSELRVKNIGGLRVADSSVMPSITSGNTHIPVLMIAEKASDMIRSSISCVASY